jgi:hypothetical protein
MQKCTPWSERPYRHRQLRCIAGFLYMQSIGRSISQQYCRKTRSRRDSCRHIDNSGCQPGPASYPCELNRCGSVQALATKMKLMGYFLLLLLLSVSRTKNLQQKVTSKCYTSLDSKFHIKFEYQTYHPVRESG